jgi:CheY-like chemotaxis protein
MIDLNNTALWALDRRRSALGEHIEIVFSAAPEPALTPAAEADIEELLDILAADGANAMPAGGTLHVGVSFACVRDSFAALCLAVPLGDYVVLSITDSGDGRPPDPAFGDRLFAARALAEACGGAVSEHRSPGIGTVVRAFLPAAVSPGVHLPSAEETAPLGAETILLVEDEHAVRAYLATILSEQGYEVLSAAGGREAELIACRHHGPIDLLVTDMAVSGSSGAEIVARIGQLRPGISVLRMSGHAGQVRGKAEAILEKPFRPAVLLQRVRALLDCAPRLDSALHRPAAAVPGRTPPSRPCATGPAAAGPAKE